MDKLTPLRPVPTLVALAITLVIWFVIPVPEGVNSNAWHLLALFLGTIAAIIGKALPIGAIAIVAIAVVAVTGVTNPNNPAGALKDALSGFSNPLIWLIGVSIMVSHSLKKTGLGARIGYGFIALFGKKTLGIAYSLTLADAAMAPVTPSNTARGGGIIHPLMRSIASSFDSTSEEGSRQKIARYLALVNYNANPITSAMFITATAPNPLVVEFISESTGGAITLTWGQWALAALIPGLVALVIMPLIIFWLYPPEIRETVDAPAMAREHLQEMGSLSLAEKITLSVFILMLMLWAGLPAWIFGPGWAVNSTTTAFIGLSILLCTGVMRWQDILESKSAWDTIVWFAALVMMATFLGKLGLMTWMSESTSGLINKIGIGWQASALILILIYVYAHYFFASTTAHITAMFPAFFMAGLAVGAPPLVYGLALGFSSSLMMSLTHYGTGTAPVVFGSGYVTLSEWWKTGFIMSVVNMLIWLVVGGLWWHLLGYW